MFRNIGETVGVIWKLLKEEGPLSLSAIAGKVKHPQTRICTGIGWLAREDKLVFNQTKQGTSVSLKK